MADYQQKAAGKVRKGAGGAARTDKRVAKGDQEEARGAGGQARANLVLGYGTARHGMHTACSTRRRSPEGSGLRRCRAIPPSHPALTTTP